MKVAAIVAVALAAGSVGGVAGAVAYHEVAKPSGGGVYCYYPDQFDHTRQSCVSR